MASTLTNQQAFLNGMGQIINTLIGGAQPSSEPGHTAWSWFAATTGPQPAETNQFMTAKVNSSTLFTGTYQNANNGGLWLDAMDAIFGSATGTVRTWLLGNYAPAQSGGSTVPQEVIDWTKPRFPTRIGLVIKTVAGSTGRLSKV